MQEALSQPAWQKALKQMQDAQTNAFQRALKPVDVSALVNPSSGIDFSAISKSVAAYQNAEVQEALKRLSTGSPAARWSEIARQIIVPTIPKIDFDAQQAITALQLELEAVEAPEFGPVAAGKATSQGAAEAGFDWIKYIPRKAQIRLLILVLTIIASLTQGTASATHEEMPPGLAEFEAAALLFAGALNEQIGPMDDNAPDED